MNYEEFKEELLRRLKEFYGEDAKVETTEVIKYNGIKLDGLCIKEIDTDTNMTPILYVQNMYENYEAGESMEDCMGKAIEFIERNTYPEYVKVATEFLDGWDVIKDKVYPFLLSTKSNMELLKDLVSKEMLDLSIVYMIRDSFEGGASSCVRITRKLLERYDISEDKLHATAMDNLRNDGYAFKDMADYVNEILASDISLDMDLPKGFMHVLSNGIHMYGAAGILDRELLRRVIPDKNHYIVPASIHETIFIEDDGVRTVDDINAMIREVNSTCVTEGERLEDHCYYYDAESGEIQICE